MKSERTKSLELKRERLLQDVAAVDAELYESRQDDAGIHLGDKVEQKSYRGEVSVYRVTKLSFYSWGKPSIAGYKKKKDGSFGSQERYVGTNWDMHIESSLTGAI